MLLTSNCVVAQTNVKLSLLIDSLKTEDQKSRALVRMVTNGEIDSISTENVGQLMSLTDSLNFKIIRSLFYTYGYPNAKLVGTVSAHNFWLLIQHADKYPYFQDSVLTLMKIEVDKDNVSGKDYAYLIDRVKVNTKQLQIYGSQMELNKDSTSYQPKPLIAPKQVNQRRNSVGLGSIEEYTQLMNNRYYGTLKKK